MIFLRSLVRKNSKTIILIEIAGEFNSVVLNPIRQSVSLVIRAARISVLLQSSASKTGAVNCVNNTYYIKIDGYYVNPLRSNWVCRSSTHLLFCQELFVCNVFLYVTMYRYVFSEISLDKCSFGIL